MSKSKRKITDSERSMLLLTIGALILAAAMIFLMYRTYEPESQVDGTLSEDGVFYSTQDIEPLENEDIE